MYNMGASLRKICDDDYYHDEQECNYIECVYDEAPPRTDRIITVNNGCCKGVAIIRKDGRRDVYHDGKCKLCRVMMADKVSMDVDRVLYDNAFKVSSGWKLSGTIDPFTRDISDRVWAEANLEYDHAAAAKLYQGIWQRSNSDDDMPRLQPDTIDPSNIAPAWNDLSPVHLSEEGKVAFDRLGKTSEGVIGCPEWADPEVWWNHSGQCRPMYQFTKMSQWKWDFHKFLIRLRTEATESRFIKVSPMAKKAALATLVTTIGVGGFYKICQNILNRGEKVEIEFEQHGPGLASSIPEGQGYWDANNLETLNTPGYVH